MSKIKIEVSNAQMDVLNELLSMFLSPSKSKTRYSRVIRSALTPLTKKILSKRVNDFPDNKKFKLNIPAYEAHFLEEYLRICTDFIIDDFAKNTVRMICDEINQKLA